jgi:hypothetical protein
MSEVWSSSFDSFASSSIFCVLALLNGDDRDAEETDNDDEDEDDAAAAGDELERQLSSFHRTFCKKSA